MPLKGEGSPHDFVQYSSSDAKLREISHKNRRNTVLEKLDHPQAEARGYVLNRPHDDGKKFRQNETFKAA